MSSGRYVVVCPDCGAQYPVEQDAAHRCDAQGQRMAAELVDLSMRNAENGCGLLWLYRIGYRIRQRMNGLEMYGDRARLGKYVCELGGEIIK